MPYILVDGKKVYVTKEVYIAYKKGERKNRYFEKDIKRERVKINKNDKKEQILPKKEISFEYLIWEEGRDFTDESENIEEDVIKKLMIEIVREAIKTLTEDEMENLNEKQMQLTPVYYVISGLIEDEIVNVYVSSNEIEHHFIMKENPK